MRGFHNNSFDPQTLVILEAAFDEAWLTLKAIGNTTVKPDELARSMLALAMEGERDPALVKAQNQSAHEKQILKFLPDTREHNRASKEADLVSPADAVRRGHAADG